LKQEKKEESLDEYIYMCIDSCLQRKWNRMLGKKICIWRQKYYQPIQLWSTSIHPSIITHGQSESSDS
jgi:hypothetical protein